MGLLRIELRAIVWASSIVFVPRTLGRTWGTRRLPSSLFGPTGRDVESRGIPHLAKNERDMGHPTILGGVGVGGGGPSITFEVVTTDEKGRGA
jgi:hypothetical protein